MCRFHWLQLLNATFDPFVVSTVGGPFENTVGLYATNNIHLWKYKKFLFKSFLCSTSSTDSSYFRRDNHETYEFASPSDF